MDIYPILNALVITFNFFLALVIFFSRSKSKSFLITLIGAIIWNIAIWSIYSGVFEGNIYFQIVLPRLAFLGATSTVLGLIVFQKIYVENKTFSTKSFVGISIILSIFFLCTPYIVDMISYNKEGMVKFEYGPLYPLFGIVFIGSYIYTYQKLLQQYLKARKNSVFRVQLRFFLIGISLSFGFGILSNLIFPLITGESSYSRYGPLALIFFTISAAYGIFRHHLFDVKLIVSELVLGILGVIMFLYIIFSTSIQEIIINIIFFILYALVAYYLMKSFLSGSKHARQLKRTNVQLERSLEEKDLFLRMTSHQLRTPLTSLNGFLALILEQWNGKYKMDKVSYEDLVRVYINAQRLTFVVNDILAMNAINAQRFGIALRPAIDLKEEMTYLIEDMKYFIRHYETEVVFKTIGKNFTLQLDVVRMKEVFLNLIVNAIYYGNKKVWITLIDDGARIEIRFRDNGPGISITDTDKLFKERFRGNLGETKNPNGSGLGLTISREVVRLHHGSLKLENPGSKTGAVFVVRLPKKQPKVKE